jgi:hypothetical protein
VTILINCLSAGRRSQRRDKKVRFEKRDTSSSILKEGLSELCVASDFFFFYHLYSYSHVNTLFGCNFSYQDYNPFGSELSISNRVLRITLAG